MKKIIVFFSLLLICVAVTAQKRYTDSLLNVMHNSKNTNTRLETARYYTWTYVLKGTDSLVYCGEQLLKIGETEQYPDLVSYGKSFMGYGFGQLGHMYKALQYNIEALKIAEKVSNNLLFAYIANMYGLIYAGSNSEKCKQYYRRTIGYLEGDNRSAAILMKRSVFGNLGIRFVLDQRYDSALVYLRKAEELCTILKDSSGSVYSSIGRAHLGLNQPALAYAYFQLNVSLAKRLNVRTSGANLGMARYYNYIGKPDSALAYLTLAYPGKRLDSIPPNQSVDPALLYYEAYKLKGDDRKALFYLEKHRAAKAQYDSVAQIQQIQSLTFEEDQRQLYVEQEKLQQQEERKHNLQYAGIALALVSFVILFLLLSHSMIANQKLIRFIGVIALLIVFEFLNLLLHPWLGAITHHSPVLMLLAMVCIAALLIPLHHKLEHWITHKMVEKNNKIKLAAAKKIIATLEHEPIN